MEKLEIPETYRKSTQTPRIIPTSEEDLREERRAFEIEWEGIPYKPLFNCPQCKGAGFIHPEKPDGFIAYNRMVPCNYPRCYMEAARAYRRGEIIEQSGVIGLKQTFETFNKTIGGSTKAYNAAWKFAGEEPNFIWLIIFGGVGNGKTHLLNAIANKVMERGCEVKLIMMADLLSELRMAIETNQTDYKLKELKTVPYLLIDEYGLEYGTDWEKEKEEELLASRWANGRFTAVATNRDIDELPARIRSRFQDRHLSRWVKNEAGDYRGKRPR